MGSERGAVVSSPAASVVEEVAGAWPRELLGLPHDSSFGFVIGGQMANFTALAAARDHVLARAGVIITPDIPDAIDSPTGEFTFGMLMQVAKLYRSQAGARFVSAKERAILAGIPVGPAPIGYRKRADRKLEVDPETAPIVRQVFERWARGDGRGAVAELLDTVPHVNPKTKTAAPWSREAVSRIIKNRLYATGRLQYGEIVSEWDAGAIVDEPLWHAAQRVVPPRPARAKDAGWLLTGLVRCASCSKTLKTSTNRSQYGVYRNYKCRKRGCPAPVIVSARRLEPYIAMRTAAVQHEFTANDQATDLGPLEDALAAAEVRLAQVEAPEVQDAFGDRYLAVVKERRQARDDAAAALGAARQESGVPPLSFELADVWDGLSPTDRRNVLRMFWKEIRVAPRGDAGQEIKFIARGPHAEAEVTLPAA